MNVDERIAELTQKMPAATEVLCRPFATVASPREAEGSPARASRIHDRAGKTRPFVRIRSAQRRCRAAERRRADHSSRGERARGAGGRGRRSVRRQGCGPMSSKSGRSWHVGFARQSFRSVDRNSVEVGMETVGFVGVGKIGMPISANLIKSGYRVVGYRLSLIHI